jgi:hypothetical protein
MYLQYVDIRAQAFHTFLHRIKDVLPAQSHLIYHITIIRSEAGERSAGTLLLHTEEAFREDDELAAGNGVLLEGFADDAF